MPSLSFFRCALLALSVFGFAGGAPAQAGAEGAGVVGVAGASVVEAGVAGAAGTSAGSFCMVHQPSSKAATSPAMPHDSQPKPPRAGATGAAATAGADTIHPRRAPT